MKEACQSEDVLKRRVEELDAELAQLSYAISHDLRAPLRAVSGFAQALVEDHAPHLDPTGQDYTRRIMAAAKRMDGMIEGLLLYSRLTRAEISLSTVALEPAVAEALKKLGDLDADISVESPMPEVVAHRASLVDAVAQLVGNAVKFVDSSRRPVVRLRAESRGDDRVRLWVEDNGIGIAESNFERVFGVFERLHKPDQYPGAGMGLALVRRAASRMNGQAGVESVVGEGSKFWLELPGVRSVV
jgi:light-regulated signal transduction histidine kinase (bacteriophytochrome)